MDDDEDFEEEPQVVTVVYEEEDPYDEDEEDEEDTIARDAISASYVAKGFSDRALVDEQAREEDAKKKQKRDRLASLKQSVTTMTTAIKKKEREIHDLEIVLQKDEFLERREEVALRRKVETEVVDMATKENRQTEMEDIKEENDREERRKNHGRLEKDLEKMKSDLAETVRAIATLEQEILRT